MTLYGLNFVDSSEAAGGDADAVVSLDSFLLIVLVRDNSDAVGGDAKEVVSLVSFSSFFSMVEVGGDAEAVLLLDSLSSVGEDCIAWDSVCLASFSFVSGDFMVVTLLLFDTPTGSKDTDSSSSSDSSWMVDNCIAAFARWPGRLNNLLDRRKLDRKLDDRWTENTEAVAAEPLPASQTATVAVALCSASVASVA